MLAPTRGVALALALLLALVLMLALAVTGNIIHDWLRQLEQRGLNQAMTHSTLPARREEVVSSRMHTEQAIERARAAPTVRQSLLW